MEETHWRSLGDEKYLGSWEFGPGETKVFTIKSVGPEPVTSSNGRTETLLVAHFEEGKPLILNKTNKKAIEATLKTGFINRWVGNDISVHVKKVKFGSGMVDGLRVIINPSKQVKKPVAAELPTLEKGTDKWDSIVNHLVDPANKERGFEEMFKAISNKYKVTAILKKQLKKQYDESAE